MQLQVSSCFKKGKEGGDPTAHKKEGFNQIRSKFVRFMRVEQVVGILDSPAIHRSPTSEAPWGGVRLGEMESVVLHCDSVWGLHQALIGIGQCA